MAIFLAAGPLARSADSGTAGPPAGEAAGTPEAILASKPATGALPANYQPSVSLTEIVKMAQAGVSEEVLLSYIRNSNKAFNPTSEDIIFLNDLGVSEAVLKALINNQPGAPAPKPAPPVAPPPPAEPAAVVESAAVVAPPVVDAAPATAVVVTQPAQVATVSYFYDSLSPYGTWVYVGGYGWCWQPTVAVVSVGWRPYCDRGRWVDSDCGWYWHSDYSWGWAAFHYGRWHHHARIGWVWIPDTVWGPSWVLWRNSPTYCGWAPLPPAACYRPGFGFTYRDAHVSVGFEFGLSFSHYTFVPVSRFCDRAPRNHIVALNQTKVVYNNTTVINNYYTGNNNTVINRGVPRETIASVSKTPITRVTIKDAPTHQTGGVQHITRDNGRDVIYRPTLAKVNVERVSEQLRRPQSTPAPSPTVIKPGTKTVSTPGGSVQNPPGGAVQKAPGGSVQTAPSAPIQSGNAQQVKRSNNERLNQLVEEAKTKAREREATKHQPTVSQPQPAQPQLQQPVAKTAPAAPAQNVVPQRPVPQPSPIQRREVQQVERPQQQPVQQYQHRTPDQRNQPPQAQQGLQQYQRSAPGQSQGHSSNERGNSGNSNSNRDNSKGNSGKNKND